MEKDKKKIVEGHEYSWHGTLTEYVVEEGVEEIGNSAFCGCTGLENIKMVRGIKKIGGSCFYSCERLTKIVFKEGLEEIGSCAFSHSGLEEVTLTKGIRKIGPFCFYNAKKLKELEIYEGVEEIQFAIFDGTSLEILTLPIHNISHFHKYALGSDVSGFGRDCSGPPLPTLKTLRLRLPLSDFVPSIPFPNVTEKDDGQLVRFIEEQQRKYRTWEHRILDTIFFSCFTLKCSRNGLYNAHGTPVLARVYRFWFRGAQAPFPIQRSTLRL